jgi:hypothetical protein
LLNDSSSENRFFFQFFVLVGSSVQKSEESPIFVTGFVTVLEAIPRIWA